MTLLALDVPPEGSPLPTVLKFLMQAGIRPRGELQKWTQAELAAACGIKDDREVRYWLKGKHLPSLSALQNAFFGADKATRRDLREKLIQSYRLAEAKRDGVNSYAKFATVPALWKDVKTKLRLSDGELPELYAENTTQIAWTISMLNRRVTNDDALRIASESRARVFDDKYGNWSEENDERHAVGIEKWNIEFSNLLQKAGVSFSSKILVVGIGCGLEGVGIYDKFENLYGIDISRKAISRASQVFVNADLFVCQAEFLPQELDKIDCYISLKTFSSSFFDIGRAITASAQVLKSTGVFICSIPRGYGYSDSGFLPGIMRTNYRYNESEEFVTYSYADPVAPFEIIDRIVRRLYISLFDDVRIFTGVTEHYIIARKR